MSKSYSGASFSTKGTWLIPYVFGWSKSVVSFGFYQIGVMYTIHITPFFNIGVNNPKHKLLPQQENEVDDLRVVDNTDYEEMYDKHAVNVCGCGNGPCECEADVCNCHKYLDIEAEEEIERLQAKI